MQPCLKLVLALLFTCLSLASRGDQMPAGQRVLLINSYDPLFPTYARRLEGLNSVFSAWDISLDIEYMDSKRHFDTITQQRYLDLLRQKLKERPVYDAIIASDDNALTMVLDHGKELFPGVPIVFNGLNDEALAFKMNERADVTGVVESVSTAGSLQLMRTIKPARHRLSVITDSTPSGQADLKRVLKASEKYPDITLNILDLSTLSWEEYTEILSGLASDDAILLLSAFRDKHRQSVLFQETLDILKRHANVPIYHLWEHGLGQGILGGMLINQFEQGRESALMVESILKGKPVKDIPVLTASTILPMFDYRELERYDIAINSLPDNTQILFEPETIFDNYRYELSIVLMLMIFLFAVALYLGREAVLRSRLAEEAKKQNNFLRSLMNAMPDLVYLKGLDGKYLACNRRFEDLRGAPEAEILGKTDFDFLEPELANFLRINDQLAMRLDEPSRNEERQVFKSDGHEELLETIKAPLKNASGEIIGVLGISRDISERVESEQKIKTLMQAVEQSPVSVMISDPEGKIEYVNNSFEKVSGYSKLEVLGKDIAFLQADKASQKNYEMMWNALKENRSWDGEFYNRGKNGECFWEYAHMSPILMEDEYVAGYLSVKEDITLRRKQEEKIRFQAHFDALTNLPNRALSQDRLQQMINSAQRSGAKVGVLYIDLDDFKKVNDTLGHGTGDQLLISIGKRLVDNIREEDTVGRLGGDEFIILLNDMPDISAGGNVASNLINELEQPIVIDDRQLMISASIGIAVFPDDGSYPEELMRKADLAMYNAKHNGGSHSAFYTSELNERVERRFLVEQQLRGALDRQEFYLEYQPKVELETEQVMGFEALLRWKNSGLGIVTPVEFIPIAEQTGAITAIGYYVFESVLKMMTSLPTATRDGLVMSINLSPRQFRDQNFEAKILALLEKYKVKASDIEFEITEGLFIDELPGVKETLTSLHAAGIRLAMDDFGTGYSSLSYLRRYPFDTLKVDREFVQGITENQADRELIYAAISMAHSLGLDVVAEGVETEQQKMILDDLTCDIIQGYLYSRPVSGAELLSVLESINQPD